MDETESYQMSTTEFSEVVEVTESGWSPEIVATSTILSQITETMAEATTDIFSSSERSMSSATLQSDLKFSNVDYIVFGIMLAMSGENEQRTAKSLDQFRNFAFV